MHPSLIDLEQTFASSPMTQIVDPLLDRHRIELWLKRDDLLHPVISGNKWRKLKYCLDHVLTSGFDTLVSMGGAYSNHLHALAHAGMHLGISTVGWVRGEQPERLTPTLKDCRDWGMELRFVSRDDYRQLRQYKRFDEMPHLSTGQYWLPEGGAQTFALKGVKEMVEEIDIPYEVLCVACGTGATLAGCVAAVNVCKSVIGFAALKNAGYLSDEVRSLLPTPCSHWMINGEYHFGGFAKTSSELNEFIDEFELNTGIPLEPVYTGKMIYALFDLIDKGYFKPGLRIVAVHSGGLQGKRQLSKL